MKRQSAYNKTGYFKAWMLNIMAFALLNVGFAQAAGAGVIGSEQVIESSLRQERITGIEQLVARDDVQRQLFALGVAPEAVLARVENMTDREITDMSEQLDQAVAGGDALAVLGIVFLVLLVLELVGVTDIFKSV
jgi:hypothetical protein